MYQAVCSRHWECSREQDIGTPELIFRWGKQTPNKLVKTGWMVEGQKCFGEISALETGVGKRGEISYRVVRECIQWLLSKKLTEVNEACSCLGEESSRQVGLHAQRPWGRKGTESCRNTEECVSGRVSRGEWEEMRTGKLTGKLCGALWWELWLLLWVRWRVLNREGMWSDLGHSGWMWETEWEIEVGAGKPRRGLLRWIRQETGRTRSGCKRRKEQGEDCINTENFALCNFITWIFILILIPQSKTHATMSISNNLQENPLVCSVHCCITLYPKQIHSGCSLNVCWRNEWTCAVLSSLCRVFWKHSWKFVYILRWKICGVYAAFPGTM